MTNTKLNSGKRPDAAQEPNEAYDARSDDDYGAEAFRTAEETASENTSRDTAFATVATVGVVAVGAVIFEAALIPGLLLGVAAALAPRYAPAMGSALGPLFRSTVRSAYRFGQKSRQVFAEAQEHMADIAAEVSAESQAKSAAKAAATDKAEPMAAADGLVGGRGRLVLRNLSGRSGSGIADEDQVRRLGRPRIRVMNCQAEREPYDESRLTMTTLKLKVEHQVRGRIRLKVPSAKGNLQLLEQIKQTFGVIPGIEQVIVNPTTGSVVLTAATPVWVTLVVFSLVHFVEMNPPISSGTRASRVRMA